ncbi:uncharacterized protein LOC144056607 [Vanacampus margaritifer]
MANITPTNISINTPPAVCLLGGDAELRSPDRDNGGLPALPNIRGGQLLSDPCQFSANQRKSPCNWAERGSRWRRDGVDSGKGCVSTAGTEITSWSPAQPKGPKRPGSQNVKPDALSRLYDPEPVTKEPETILSPDCVIGAVTWPIEREVKQANGEATPPKGCPANRLFVPEQLRPQVIHWGHTSLLSCHPGVRRTIYAISRRFWWPSMEPEVREYIEACSVCARNKTSTRSRMGLLQPLPIPSRPWAEISLDFVTGLPLSKGKTTVLTVVDRFSKMVRFLALSKLPSAKETAEVMIKHVFRVYGFPRDIVSDRGPQFVSRFWKEFCRLIGAKASLTSGYHPEANGQSERLNQQLETGLRCLVSQNPASWSKHLVWVEFAHNSLPTSATGLTPFKCVFGYDPPFFSNLESEASVPSAHALNGEYCANKHSYETCPLLYAYWVRGMVLKSTIQPPRTPRRALKRKTSQGASPACHIDYAAHLSVEQVKPVEQGGQAKKEQENTQHHRAETRLGASEDDHGEGPELATAHRLQPNELEHSGEPVQESGASPTERPRVGTFGQKFTRDAKRLTADSFRPPRGPIYHSEQMRKTLRRREGAYQINVHVVETPSWNRKMFEVRPGVPVNFGTLTSHARRHPLPDIPTQSRPDKLGTNQLD